MNDIAQIYSLSRDKKDIERIKQRSTKDFDKVIKQVTRIIDAIKRRGDSAVSYYTNKLNKVKLTDFKVSDKEKQEAYNSLSEKEINAIKNAANNIRKFCEIEKPKPWQESISSGIVVGQLVKPLDNVGVYVPAGRYPLPSSALMNIIPAKVAGVNKIIVCTPPRKDGKANEAIIVATDIAGADSVFKIGGAKAIAAMAYGTETVPKVDKIVGPGGIYVTAAKKVVFGDVGIDFLAGPTEVLIIADGKANPKFVAADMLAQAEHDTLACALLVTDSKELANRVKSEIRKQLKKLLTAETIKQSLKNYGGIILVKDLNQAFEFANDFAPEHLEIMIDDSKLLEKVRNVGAVFLGEYSVEAAGDYASGPNHVLPTNGVAKVRAGLSVRDFLKMPTVQILTKDGLESIKETIITLADLEFLAAHANSVKIRFGG